MIKFSLLIYFGNIYTYFAILCTFNEHYVYIEILFN